MSHSSKNIIIKALSIIIMFVFIVSGLMTAVNITSNINNVNDKAFLVNSDTDNKTLPINIYALPVAKAKFPCWWQIAAKCINGDIAFQSFIVQYHDGIIVIDPVHNKAWHEKFLFKTDYDQMAYKKQAEILKTAKGILVTHEHWDHIGVILDDELFESAASKLWLTDSQYQGVIKSGLREASELKTNGVQVLNSTTSNTPFSGISILSTPGHSDGHQIIYIQLQNGKRFILTGDIAYNYAGFEENKTRPLIASLLGGENALKVAEHVTTLAAFIKSNKDYLLIPAHDIKRTELLIETLP